ncbi:MAG: 6-bladed beta-propeller [Bacteroidetes bacterium]|nr:6-bladed beta-propeller [Bacteroidota bacterium]
MNRKEFVKNAVITSASFFIAKDLLAKPKGPIYGHNEKKYRLDTKWGSLNPEKTPVNDCHEMVQDSKGRILLLTNETKNNIIIYNKSGRLISTWGNEFPGAHGLTLQKTGKDDLLFITDTKRNQVFKTTIEGKIIFTIDAPLEAGIYQKKEKFVPTETAVLENGEFYIADGYGSQYVLHYDANGKLLNYFGGRGDGEAYLDNAHGVCIDYRQTTPTLLVTDRNRTCFKRFSLEGKLIEVIHIPGAGVCRPVIHGDYLYAAVLRSPKLDVAGSGFVTILNKDNKVVSNLGGSEPVYENGLLKPLSQTEKIFFQPHDVCIDNEGDMYVAQWASGKVYPYKLRQV